MANINLFELLNKWLDFLIYKDDENHDPQWSEEVLISNELKVGGITIGKDEVDFMNRTTVAVFEVLERAWASVIN